jgi:SAM-dependent methyltransferase
MLTLRGQKIRSAFGRIKPLIHVLNTPTASAHIDSIEIQPCGLVRVTGWAAEKIPAVVVEADGKPVTLSFHYRTLRPDVRACHPKLAVQGDFIGFASEYLLSWLPQPYSCRVTLFVEGKPLFTGMTEVVRPHYDNLFTTSNVLGRDDVYGVGPPNTHVDPQVLAIARMLQGPTLDFGCGSGALVRELRCAGNEAYGLEIDRAPIRDALGEDVREHVTLYDGAFPIPFPDASFNSVICSEVLEHIPDYQSALREMVRVARRQVVLTVPEITAIPSCFPHAVPWHLLEGSHVNFFTQRSLYMTLSEFFRIISFGRITPCEINGCTFYVSVVAFCEK